MNDQPTTCPACGARTEIVQEIFLENEFTQFHKCLSGQCGQEFAMQQDEELMKIGSWMEDKSE